MMPLLYTRWFKYDRDWFFCRRWRLTCASKCLVIKVFKKKISPGHIWTTLYLVRYDEVFAFFVFFL
jgi:hypothetical protein